MRDALRGADVPRALEAIVTRERDHYRKLLSSLTVPSSQIDQMLPDISPVSLDEYEAEYEMIRVEQGGLSPTSDDAAPRRRPSIPRSSGNSRGAAIAIALSCVRRARE